MNDSVVMIADVCGSRKMATEERYEGQLFLKTAIIQVNENFKQDIEAPFMITRGDEFQGVLKNLAAALNIIFEFERLLFPLELRYGVGKGQIHTLGSKIPIEMDGPAFHHANESLNSAKKKRVSIIWKTDDQKIDILVNNIFILLYAIKSRWNSINYNRYWSYKELGTFEKVAQRENVTAQAIWDSMQNMRVIDVLNVEKDLMTFLAEEYK